MFTEKESIEFEEYLKDITIEDLPRPRVPTIKFPIWLDPIIKEKAEKRLSFIKSIRTNKARFMYDYYPGLIDNFNQIKIVFTDIRMKPIWNMLLAKSSTIVDSFFTLIFKIQNDYHGALSLKVKHENEIKSSKKIINLTKNLIDAMEEYHCHYYGHMIQKNHHKLSKALSKFAQATVDDLEDFEQHRRTEDYMNCEHWPLSRKSKAKNGLAIFFMRKACTFFETNFGNPKYKIVSELTNIIFETSYSENDVLKNRNLVKTSQ